MAARAPFGQGCVSRLKNYSLAPRRMAELIHVVSCSRPLPSSSPGRGDSFGDEYPRDISGPQGTCQEQESGGEPPLLLLSRDQALTQVGFIRQRTVTI